MNSLWNKQELIEATGASDPTNKFLDKTNSNIFGVSIDERTIKKNDLFIALKGPKFDGHNFIASALKKGASGVIVSDHKIAMKFNALHVMDTMDALIKMAKFSRNRFKGKTICITGSSGKTSTRYMAMEALQNYGKTHGSEGNNNNLLGLSLTLARLSSTNNFCVLELGMNHGGEIKKLTKIASPNITLITNISNSHIANFKNEEEIAEAKSEIFLGIKNLGIAIINTDEKWCDFITSKAKKANAKIHFFGSKSVCETKILKIENGLSGTNVYFNNKVNWHLNNFNYLQAINAISVIAILEVLNLDVNKGMRTISNLKPLPGRGDMLTISFKKNKNNSIVIDDSYNANPSSMQMALKTYYRSKSQFPNLKSIIIIGDMLELGKHSKEMHQNLVPIINKIQPSLLITVGIETKQIITNLKINLKCFSYLEVEKLIIDLPKIIQPNQYILLKGSNGTGLWKITKFIKNINNFQEIDNVA
mgnify:FL=1